MNPRDPRFHSVAQLAGIVERLVRRERVPELEALRSALEALLTGAEAETPSEAVPQVAPGTVVSAGAWYERDVRRFAVERIAVARWIEPVEGSALFGIDEEGRLHADGLLRLEAAARPRVALRFPDGYPATPPELFLFGEEGATPVLAEVPPGWPAERDCSALLASLARRLEAWLEGRERRSS